MTFCLQLSREPARVQSKTERDRRIAAKLQMNRLLQRLSVVTAAGGIYLLPADTILDRRGGRTVLWMADLNGDFMSLEMPVFLDMASDFRELLEGTWPSQVDRFIQGRRQGSQ